MIEAFNDIAGPYGKIKGNIKADVTRMAVKLTEEIEEQRKDGTLGKVDTPILKDVVRCMITVNGPAQMEAAYKAIMQECRGRIINVKPKLNSHLINVTIHTGVNLMHCQNIEENIPMVGEIQLCLD